MASDANEYFGFELLNKLVDNDLVKKEDVIVLFVHWYLVKNGFKCIGLGDSKTFDAATDRGTDFLPPQWNQQSNYSLRYVKDEKLYIAIATKSDTDLLINFLRVNDNCTSNVQFPIEATIANVHGQLESLMPNHRAIMNKIRLDLVEPVYNGTAREISTQTRPETSDHVRDPDDDPLRVRPQPPRIPRQPWNPEADPRNIGRSDLDPFSQGGGMIFNPFASPRGIPGPFDPRGPGGLGVPGRLPPGAVPPGARFDPFGPPEIDERPRRFPRDPDADHLPPPGYDDMFM